jgi:hypothetical protein
MIKEAVLETINKYGYSLCRHQIFNRENFGLLEGPQSVQSGGQIRTEIVKKIMDFFQKVPPFYFDNIPAPLKIEGAWRGNIQNGRKQQLAAIERKDLVAYQNLLNNMFCNEMIYAMWEGHYLKQEMIGKKLPKLFLEWMDGYKYLTGRSEDDLIYQSGGAAWGCKTKKGIIKLIDPAQGIKAQNIINFLNFAPPSSTPVVCDLGSGFGGDMEKVARWYGKPLRVILVDIPLNLTTAYAYISMGFKDTPMHLIDSSEQLQSVLATKTNQLEFIFVPSLFVEGLKNQKINVLHNHGSFSEMDAGTIDFYLQNLLGPQTDFMIEINSNRPAVLAKSHLEVASSQFNIPSSHALLQRTPTWITAKGHRYLNSVYANKKLLMEALQ